MKWKGGKVPVSLSLRNTIFTLVTLAAASGFCALLGPASSSDEHVPLIFVLAVMIISLYTEGYIYGVFGSVLGVIGVNYIFTYPYLAFNFSITGYPLTFIIMLAVSFIIGTLTTRLKQQERMHTEIEKETIRANLLRAISHDLRTPLTSIVGATGAILDNYDSLSEQTKRELLSEAREDAQWLIRMVENILSITRIGADPAQANLSKKPEAVEEIIGEILEKFKKQFPGTAVSVKVPDELLLVPMDAMLVEQVIFNILENAVIHGVTTTQISITVYRRGADAVFEIADNGKGIPSELYPQLFQGNFSVSHERQSDSKRSMGIGLSVCTSIIRAHGGNLAARSLPDSGGTEFSFTLPMTEF